MINLYVGDSQEYLSSIARKNDPDATLVDCNNYTHFLSNNFTRGSIYTSLADLPKIDNRNILHELMLKATTIFYSPPPGKWSDHKDFSWESQEKLVEFLLSNIHYQRQNVVGINNIDNQQFNYLELFNQRLTDDPCLWISGCSIAHGVGVEPSQRFGDIISKKINRLPVFLTKSSSSLEVQADQILRSDIRKGDIVIWALTSELRAPKFNKVLRPETDIDIRTDQTRLYKAITSIYQVTNFCEKISARLMLIPAICTEHIRTVLVDNRHYHDLPYQARPLDYGTDNLHPGPAQHMWWANYCIEFLINSKEEKV